MQEKDDAGLPQMQGAGVQLTRGRCERCGQQQVSVVPYFAVGSGSVYRTLQDDIYCRRCGHMGQPVYGVEEGGADSTVTGVREKSG
jgi:ribosomal protein L37E